MSIQCFGLQLPDFECLHAVRSIEELVEVYTEAIRIIQPEAPYILVGFGMGCQLAYEAAVQMGPERVASVVFIDGQVTKERGFHQDAIWYGLYTLIAQEISVDRFVKEMQRRRRFEDQLQYMLHFCPKDMDPSTWDQSVNVQLCKTHFCAMAGEVYDPDKYYNGAAFLFSSLEFWEEMVKEGCEELLAESKTTLRQHVNKKDYDETPYVQKWVMEELPISSDLMWGEGSSTSGNYDTDVSECFEMEEGGNWDSDCGSSDQ